MKSKYVTIGDAVHKETYDPVEAKYPFDTSIIYTKGGAYTTQNIRDMLQTAYDAGARHALQELGYSLDKIRKDFQ